MRGHVHKRGSRWAYVVDVGRDPATGKRKQRTKGGFATKALAEEALGDFMSELRAGTAVASATRLGVPCLAQDREGLAQGHGRDAEVPGELGFRRQPLADFEDLSCPGIGM